MRKILTASAKLASGTGLAIVFRALSAKVLALMLGTTGLGIYSILRQVTQTAITVASLNGDVALVQALSARDEEGQRSYLSSIVLLIGASTMVVAIVLWVCAPSIIGLLNVGTDARLTAMVRWLAPAVAIGVIAWLFQDLAAAFQKHAAYAWIQVVSALCLAALSFPVARAYQRGSIAALPVLLAAASGAGAVTAFALLRKTPALHFRIQLPQREALLHFVRVSGAIVAANGSGIVAVLLIRLLVARSIGMSAAGLFDAAWSITLGYTGLLLSTLQVYYFPELTRQRTYESRSGILDSTVRFCVYVSVPLIVTMIVLKPMLLAFLYSREFLDSLALLRWILIADYFKISCWILAGPMLAYAETKWFFWSEVISNAVLVALVAMLLARSHEIEKVGVAITILYVAYLPFGYLYARRKHGFRMQLSTALSWVAGLATIVGASSFHWGDVAVRPLEATIWVVAVASVAGALLFGEFRRDGRKEI